MGKTLKALGSIFSPPMAIANAMKSKGSNAASAAPIMPDPESAAARLAARKKIEERRAKGRAGTIYTGGSYSNQALGGTS